MRRAKFLTLCVFSLLFTTGIYADEKMAVDPVCGMEVDVKDAEKKGLVVEFQGKKYYFCMKEDMEKFKSNPEKFVKSHSTDVEEHCKMVEEKHDMLMESYERLFELNKRIRGSLNASEQRKLIDEFIKETDKFLKLVDEIHKMVMEDIEMGCEKKGEMLHHKR